jgi:uncharacterized protein (DUF433 family)
MRRVACHLFVAYNQQDEHAKDEIPGEVVMSAEVLDRHIEITPDVAGGKPRIAGHRITVQNIVIWHEHLGKSVDEISAEYNLPLAAIYAALAYYFDHREEIDRSIAADEAFVQALREQTESPLATKLNAYRGG